MISYEITSDDLVELISLACAHALEQEKDGGSVEHANELLAEGDEILKRTGVRYPSKFWEKCERALEARLHLAETPPANPGAPEDPYLWGSGT